MDTANAGNQHDAGNQLGGLDSSSRVSAERPIFSFVSASVCAFAMATLTLFYVNADVEHTNTVTPPARSADLPAVVATLWAGCRFSASLSLSATAPSVHCMMQVVQVAQHLWHANQSGSMTELLFDKCVSLAVGRLQATGRQALRLR